MGPRADRAFCSRKNHACARNETLDLFYGRGRNCCFYRYVYSDFGAHPGLCLIGTKDCLPMSLLSRA